VVTDTSLPAAFEQRLALLVHKLGTLVLARAAEGLAELDLTSRQYATLAILATDRPGSQQELARALSLVPAVMVGVLDELEARGLADRRRSPTDRRRTEVVLTPAGHALLARADANAAAVENELFGHLAADERATLYRAARTAVARGGGA
jgi:DNA-binding MarR family transcriptional regulator